MQGVEDRSLEVWDRLTLLLIARPAAGWEETFEELTRREIERVNVLAWGQPEEEDGDDHT